MFVDDIKLELFSTLYNSHHSYFTFVAIALP
jgi:hypothetical protein